MTEPRETSVPTSVDSVVHQLQRHDIHGALEQINKELTSHNGQPNHNKEFLNALNKECQQQGLLPQLAVEFGKQHFKDLDFNNDGYITKQELGHALRDPKMKASLNPFEREMSAYLLANIDSIQKATGDTYGIRPQALDAYVSQSATKYETYTHGQDVLKAFGTKDKFDAINTAKDGFISAAEIQNQLDFNTRALSIPGLLTPEATKNLQEQDRALEYMKNHQRAIASSVADTTFSNSISLADIQKYAELQANPRTSEKLPTIDENIVGKPMNDGGVSMDRGNKMSEVLMKYGIDHYSQLDLDGNNSISKAELNKILDSPTWKNSLSTDERKVLETMRSRFDQLATYNSNGDYGITPNSLVNYNRSETKARDEETKAASTARFIKDNFNNIDTDHNGWISADELHKTQEFYSRALSSGLVQPDKQAKIADDLKALEYLDQHRSEISSATFSSDMTKADIEKYATKKAGHLTDTFQPTDVVKPQPEEKPEQKPDPKPENKPTADEKAAAEKAAAEKAAAEKAAAEKAAAEKAAAEKAAAEKAAAEKATSEKAAAEKAAAEKAAAEKATSEKAAAEKADAEKAAAEKAAAEKAAAEKAAAEKAAAEKAAAEKAAAEKAAAEKAAAEKAAAEKAAAEKEATKLKLEKPAPEKNAFDQYIDKYYKYTDKNYGEALKDAYESGKPVVLVMGSQKTPEAVQAGAQANLDGKAVVVYVDTDKVDPNSQLGKYAGQILAQHNRQYGSTDQCVTTVFSVGGKDQSGMFTPRVATHTDWGRLNDYSNLLRRQIAETAAYGSSVGQYQQYYQNQCYPTQCR